MAHNMRSMCWETTTSVGPPYVCGGAVAGHQPFSSVGTGNSTEYYMRETTGALQWARILGIWTSNQLSQLVILASSNGGSQPAWGAGTKFIYCEQGADSVGPWPMPGCCRFLYSSPTVCLLKRFNGISVPVLQSGIPRYRNITPAGITGGNGGLVANGVYYAYVPFTGNLEFATNTPVEDGDTGIMVKSTDTSRTLVGLVRVNASAQFSDALTLSWFNKRKRTRISELTADRQQASSAWALIHTEITNEFITWVGHTVEMHLVGAATNSVASIIGTAIGVDQIGSANQATHGYVSGTGERVNVSVTHTTQALSEGYHEAHGLGCAQNGNAIWFGADAAQSTFTGRLRLHVCVEG